MHITFIYLSGTGDTRVIMTQVLIRNFIKLSGESDKYIDKNNALYRFGRVILYRYGKAYNEQIISTQP